MKCRDMAELATDYMEGALPARRTLAARWHLFLCVACRRYVSQLRQTVRFLAEGPPPRPPANESEILAAVISEGKAE